MLEPRVRSASTANSYNATVPLFSCVALTRHMYCNNPSLSDITIKFSGRVFYGHKVILSSQSKWFQAAFRNGFKESTDEAITLYEDNADALEYVLNEAYKDDPSTVREWNYVNDVHKSLAYFEVADKYEFPRIRAQTLDDFGNALYQFFHKSWDTPELLLGATKAFCSIVSNGYRISGSDPCNPIVGKILQLARGGVEEYLGILDCHRTPSQYLYKEAAKVVPEFGRDLFLQLMSGVGHKDGSQHGRNLALILQVDCPGCYLDFPMKLEYGPSGYCIRCGHFEPDWTKISIGMACLCVYSAHHKALTAGCLEPCKQTQSGVQSLEC